METSPDTSRAKMIGDKDDEELDISSPSMEGDPPGMEVTPHQGSPDTMASALTPVGKTAK